MAKKINCKWCGMGDAPRADGNHWIVKSIIPAKLDIKECAYHKAGTVSPIQRPPDKTVLEFEGETFELKALQSRP